MLNIFRTKDYRKRTSKLLVGIQLKVVQDFRKQTQCSTNLKYKNNDAREKPTTPFTLSGSKMEQKDER